MVGGPQLRRAGGAARRRRAERRRRWPSSRRPAAASCSRPGTGHPARWRPSWPGPTRSSDLIREVPGVQAANWNGPRADRDRRAERGRRAGTRAGRGPRDLGPRLCRSPRPFTRRWSPGARAVGRAGRAQLLDQAPDRPVYSNLDAAPHPADRAAIAARLGDHLASPVRFADMIEAMYRDGARVFVEVGPGVDPHSAGRIHLAGPAAPGGRLRCAGARRACSAWLRGVWHAWSSPGCRSVSSG